MKILSIVLSLALLLVIVVPVNAQLHQGSTELTLSGSGSSDKQFHDTNLDANVGIGYMLTNELEIGIRQGASYQHSDGGGDNLVGETRAALDWNFDLGKLQPYVGATLGARYGDGVSYIAGPEVGIRYWMNTDTAIFVSAAYDFSSKDFSGLRNEASDGQFVYRAGLSFSF